MKRKNTLTGILLIFMIVTLFSCTGRQTKQPQNQSHYIIRMEKPADEVPMRFSDYFVSGKLVPLETTDDNLLSDIKKIVCYDQRIFVTDQANGAGVFCFDKEGNYLYRIGQKGEGPEDFVDLTDFAVDRERRLICIHDCYTKKILIFNEKGEYQKSIYVGYSADGLEYNADKFYLSRNNPSGEHPFNLCITDLNGKIVNRSFPGDPTLITREPQFRIKGDSLYYYANLSGDTIYRLTDVPSVEFTMDYGKHTMAADDLRRYLNRQEVAKRTNWKILQEKDCIAGIDNFYPVGNYLIFNYTYQSMGYFGFYDMNTDSCRRSSYVVDDICYVGFLNRLIGSTSNQIILTIEYNDIQSGIEALEESAEDEEQPIAPEKIPAAVAALKELQNSLQEDCNPILVVYDLK